MKKHGGFFRSSYHKGLAIAYGIWWLVMAINPVHFRDWALENLLVVGAVILVWRAYPKLHISNASLTVFALFMAFHTMGSHYTYANVPLGDWIADLLDLNRNHYDRIIHFSFGLLIFWPMREVANLVIGTKKHWDDFIGLLFIISMSAIYEAIEWVTAMVVSPETALLFLGSQDDVFDAQKDHTLAITGAIISFFIAKWLAKNNRLPKPS